MTKDRLIVMTKLQREDFVFTGEGAPVQTADLSEVLNEAHAL